MVDPIVTCGRIVVPNLDTFDIERVASFRRWDRGHTCGPRIIMVGIPCIPQAHHQLHWGLRILIGGPNAIGCLQGTDDCTIIFPNDPFRRPVKSVSMKLCHRCRNLWGNGMIVEPRDAFAEPSCLYFIIDAASEFPIQLVKVIGQCHHITDNSWSWCRLDHEFHTTEQKVEITV